MKIRKILSFLLVILMCFSLIACEKETSSSDRGNNTTSGDYNKDGEKANNGEEGKSEEPQLESGKSNPLLYKVTDNKGNVAWLFGSIHVGEDYFYPLPDYVLDAFDNADSLAVEFDIVAFEKDITAATKMMQEFLITGGRTIKDYVSLDIYKKARKILQENSYYTSQFDYFLPVLWQDLIEGFVYDEIGVNYDLGIDRYMINRAYDKNKEVLNVESAEFQYGMMANYSPELQEILLESAIEGYYDKDAIKEELEEMLAVWAKGDEKEFSDMLSEEPEFKDEKEKKLYEEYNNAMVVERNKSMTDWAEKALKSGKEVFICVGAAHIVGPGAMAEMLRDRGYKVELVNSSKLATMLI